jgi:DUF4097 and DUF4098 domain-containing protein YvlB
MKRTWIVVGSVVTVVVLVFSTSQAVGLLAHEEVTETATFAAAGLDRLFVDNANGSVEVDGSATAEEITVVADISHGLQRTRHTAEVIDGALQVRDSCPFFSTWCTVHYRITVPARFAVRAASDNGWVTLRDLDGPVDVGSDNGRVELVRLTGDVLASSDNGSITGTALGSDVVLANSDNGRVELTFAEPPVRVEVDSDNGRIEIVVPDTDDTYLVDASSDNGSTDIGVRTDPASDRTIVADADNGSVTLRYP